MASLKYEIANCERIKSLKSATKHSVKQYQHHAIKFGDWCKAQYGCRHMEDCSPYIQSYADHLFLSGKSASTVHTYVAGVCRVFGVDMGEIQKPIRHTADNVRSRGNKKMDDRADAKREVSPRLNDLAAAVGIRRGEYAALRGGNLKRDESGYLCVEVVKGKGGKYQLQRIMPGMEDFVAGYFDGSDHCIFTKAEMLNKLDLHHLRALAAQRAYQYYANRLAMEPGYRAQLQEEIIARWNKYNGKKLRHHELYGQYRIRGKNRTLAISNGLPVSYDRLALMATSVFHLSHWRNDVTVCNYLLAVSPEVV